MLERFKVFSILIIYLWSYRLLIWKSLVFLAVLKMRIITNLLQTTKLEEIFSGSQSLERPYFMISVISFTLQLVRKREVMVSGFVIPP